MLRAGLLDEGAVAEGAAEDAEEAHYLAHRDALLALLRDGRGGRASLEPRGAAGVGLLNQGATCYMNSLLQALFHSPEFRRALFLWRFDPALHGEAARSIPLQLQRLFARLQLGGSAAASTKALTSAFGFAEAESREQHDVQELCRVLFDALARSAPSLAAEIDSLYAGRVAHYVRSREPCADGSLPESRREEKFLDLQVPIHDCGTLEEALRRLVQPEPLDGDNRWHCEELGRKVDALKGVDVVALPGLLCLQLLRFVFDLTTMRRRKLTEAISIPLEMDLSFMAPVETTAAVYELSAVCCHKGTAHGGHYHALLRDARRGVWLDANDAHVADLGPQQLEALFAPRPGPAPSAQTSAGVEAPISGQRTSLASSDAYFLLYRRRDLRAPEVADESVPEPHRSELLQENVDREALQRAYKVHRELLEVRVHAPTAAKVILRRYLAQELRGLLSEEEEAAATAREPQSALLSVRGLLTVAELRRRAVSAFMAEAERGGDRWPFAMGPSLSGGGAPLARLRELDACTGEVRAPLEEERLLKDVLGPPGAPARSLLLEVRSQGEDFEAWDPDGHLVVACRWDPRKGGISLASGDVAALRLPPRRPGETAAGTSAAGGGGEAPPREGPAAAEGAAAAEAGGGGEGASPRGRGAADRTPAVGAVRAAAAAAFGLARPGASPPALVAMSGARGGEVLLDDAATLLQALGGGPGRRAGPEVLCVEAPRGQDAPRPRCAERFELVRNTAHIALNHPDRPEGASELTIPIAKTATLAALKAQAAAALGLDPGGLHLSRGPKGPQLKNEAQTLRASGIADSGQCFLGHGAPCGADGFVLRVGLYSAADKSGPARAKELFSHCAKAASSVRGLRQAILEPLARWASEQEQPPFAPDGLQWRRLRLRDGHAGKQFAILRDDRTLRGALLGLADGRHVAVQVLDQDEELTPDDLVVSVRAWRYAEGRLSAAAEVVVRRSQALSELRGLLDARYHALLTKPDAEASAGEDAGEDRLEVVALASAGPPLTVKRCATLRWGESQLNATDSDSLRRPLAELRDLRDGATLVVRSARAAARGPPGEPARPAGAPPAAAARAKAKAQATGAGSSPSVVVAGCRPGRERALVIEVAHPEARAASEPGDVPPVTAEVDAGAE